MPDAHQLAMRRHAANLRLDVGCPQIDPTHHAGDERVLVGERQQPPRLLQRLPHLHRDTGVDADRIHLDAQIGRKEIPAERRHARVDPPVLRGVVAPEMLVRIDAPSRHPCSQGGTGVEPCRLDS